MIVIPGMSESLTAVGKQIVGFETTDTLVSAEVSSSARSAQCPRCSQRSSRTHGVYRRRIGSQPCMGRAVSLSVEVRRFKCMNRLCSQRTFVERIDALAPARQRRTVGLNDAVRSVAHAMGGTAAARLSAKLGMPVSRDTLLRGLRRASAVFATDAPVVVGIDDWAITRGQRYGTIVVDLERRCPIEVLDGRESGDVATWLKRHPTIQWVARDRAGAYSDATRSAIPQARQIADRWHLLVNLHETVERLLHRRFARLREAAQLVADSAVPLIQDSGTDAPMRLVAWQKQCVERRASRLARYEEVVRRRALGESLKAIGRAMGLDHRTVRKFAQADLFPERVPRSSETVLTTPHRSHIDARVAEGCTNAAAVWRELRDQGFKGCCGTVRAAMARAHAMATSTEALGRPGRRATTPSVQRTYSWLVGWHERGYRAPRSADQHGFIETLCAIEPEIAQAGSLAREFLGLVHRRDLEGFDRWFQRARTCAAPEMRRLAATMASDLSAVRAAFESPWSSGQVEGQVNRLKFLKRQMYGRAKVDLLRARVLHLN